jgi:hypothetical protein
MDAAGHMHGGDGSSCSTFGGYSTKSADEVERETVMKEMREYESSIAASAKEKTVRRIARAMQRAGLQVDPESDLDTITAELVKQLPNPKRGKTFAAAAEAQQKVCRVIADVLNDEFSPGATKPSEKFIDTSLSPVEMCRHVGEWAHSFSTGVNTEFLAVHASVKNTLRAVDALSAIMAEAMRKMRARVAKTGDAEQNRDLVQFEELYMRAQAEQTRMLSVLKNILNVQLPPAAATLELAMRDHSELNALVKKVNLRPGTSQFSDTLASAISGLGTVATVAHRVNKALKATGLSISEYVNSSGFKELERKLDTRVESGEVPKEELAKFITATKTLRESFGEHEKVSAALREEKGALALDESGETTFGGDFGDDEETTKTATKRRLEKSKSENELIIRDFSRRLGRHYDEFLSSVKAFGPLLGTETIKLTDHTDALRNAIDSIRKHDATKTSARIELSLIGRFADADARREKEQFMGRMRMIAAACEDLLELEIYRGASAQITALLAAVTSIEKTIDYYSGVFSKKVGLHAAETQMYSGTTTIEPDTSLMLPEIATSALSLQEAVNEFIYLYYVARVRANLTQTAGELEQYGEKYVDLLGNAVASKLRTLEREQFNLTKYLEGSTGFIAGSVCDTAAGGLNTTPWAPSIAGDGNVGARKAAAAYIKNEFTVKKNFYRAVQAVDLYLKAFTAAIAADPAAINDIKKMLDGTQVIARWFNENTGDAIWRAFENCPTLNANGTAVVDNASGDTVIIDPASDHYYDKVCRAGGDAFGIPQLGRNVAADAAGNKTTAAKKAVAEAYENFQALKNMVNAFARIGNMFGGKDLSSKIFMSPAQIYKAFMDYLKESAMSINRDMAPAPPADPNLVTAAWTGAGDKLKGIKPDRWQVYFGSVQTGYKGNYADEDIMFATIIKSMAAKIITVVDVYDMFNNTGPVYQLTPVRIIVGGGADDVQAIEAAAELYYRLPRLAEFYYGLLDWKSSTDTERIALLADFEGVFSGLIQFIFLRTLAAKTGDYSDSEVQTIVGLVNAIYADYKTKSASAESVTGAVLNGFVQEINRRYGIIKKSDYEGFMATVRKQLKGNPIPSNETNYAILPNETDIEADRRAPSDRFYERSWEMERKRDVDPFKDSPSVGTYKKILRDFRKTLFEKLDQGGKSLDSFVTTSKSELIKQAQLEMKREPQMEGRMKVAAKLIRSEAITGDADKLFIFHENVVAGLNVLSGIETVLRRFSKRLQALDVNEHLRDIYHALVINGYNGTPASLVGKVDELNRLFGGNVIYHLDTALLGLRGIPATGGTINHVVAAATSQQALLIAAGADTNKISLLPIPIQDNSPELLKMLSDAPIPGETPASIARKVRTIQQMARVLINFPMIMHNLVEEVFAISGGLNDLVEVNISEAGIRMNFTKIQTVVETMFSSVKQSFEQLRPSLSKETVRQYEDATRPGSINWLEKNLIDVFFRNQEIYMDPSDPRIVSASGGMTVNAMATKVQQIFAGLTRKYMSFHSLNGLTPAVMPIVQPTGALELRNAVAANQALYDSLVPPAVAPAGDETDTEWYGDTFAGLAFYNSRAGLNSGFAGVAQLDTIGFFSGLIATQRATKGAGRVWPRCLAMQTLGETDRLQPGANGQLEPNDFSIRGNIPDNRPAKLCPIYDPTESTTAADSRSLMFSYNQLVARFLQTMIDDAAGQHIYAGLINAFANGTASRSVFDPVNGAHPDLMANCTQSFMTRGDPKQGAVLLQSISWVLQRLIRDVNVTTAIPDHLVSTLTDIPLFMKERMRANLPSFIRLFSLLAAKGDFYKQIIQKTRVNLKRYKLNWAPANPGALIAYGGTNPVSFVDKSNGFTGQLSAGALHPIQSDEVPASVMKERLISVIDAVSSGCLALVNSSTEVLRELGECPVYFQTGENAIEMYKMRNGQQPLMPLSLALFFLKDNSFPVRDGNKMAFGLRDEPVSVLYPGHNMGTSAFKALYGARALLIESGPVTYAQVPGVRALLDAFNGTVSGRGRIDPDAHLQYVQTVVSALRWITDARCFKGLISVSYRLPMAATTLPSVVTLTNTAALNGKPENMRALIDATLVNYGYYGAGVGPEAIRLEKPPINMPELAPATDTNFIAGQSYGRFTYVNDNGIVTADATTAANAVFALRNEYKIDRVIQTVESSDQPTELVSMMTAVVGYKKVQPVVAGETGSSAERDRAICQIANLIDMNIIPINVHALMRGIPFANSYNYEASFEQFACQMIGEQKMPEGSVKRTSQMLLQLLEDPYRVVSARDFGSDCVNGGLNGFVHRIFRGDNGTGLGRPKFLSDQVFNKALFCSVYQRPKDWDEAGPTAGIAAARGRQAVYGGAGGAGARIHHGGSALMLAAAELRELCTPLFIKRLSSSASITKDEVLTLVPPILRIRSELQYSLYNEATAVDPKIGMLFKNWITLPLRKGSLDQSSNLVIENSLYRFTVKAINELKERVTKADNLTKQTTDQLTAQLTAGSKKASDTLIQMIIQIEQLYTVVMSERPTRPANPDAKYIRTLNDKIRARFQEMEQSLVSMQLNPLAMGYSELEYEDPNPFDDPFFTSSGPNPFTSTPAASSKSAATGRRSAANIAAELASTGRVGGAEPNISQAQHVLTDAAPAGPPLKGTELPYEIIPNADYSTVNVAITTLVDSPIDPLNRVKLNPNLRKTYKYFQTYDLLSNTLLDDSDITTLSPEWVLRSACALAEALSVHHVNTSRPQSEFREYMHPNNSKTLTYLTAEADLETGSDHSAIHKVTLASTDVRCKLELIGRARFDTRFIRNIFFITNVTRLIRLKLHRELSHSRGVLRASHSAVDAAVTEYGEDPFSPNEVWASKQRTGRRTVARFNDTEDEL